MKYLYYELKLLLSMDHYKNIISRPLYIVMVDDSNDGSDMGKIIEMLSEYHPSSNLSQLLNSSLFISYHLKFKWVT
jgi:ribosomal protein S16